MSPRWEYAVFLVLIAAIATPFAYGWASHGGRFPAVDRAALHRLNFPNDHPRFTAVEPISLCCFDKCPVEWVKP